MLYHNILWKCGVRTRHADGHQMTETAISQEDLLKPFSDPEQVSNYAEGPRRFVPGLEALHVMTGLLLAERVPEHARILVLGAGGGAEIQALAGAHPAWRFVGIDPAIDMLRLAERTLGDLVERVEFVEGYIDDAPDGPFDAAICLLTLHFLDMRERKRTVRQIHRRLSSGAPFVAAHVSFSQGTDREIWVGRYAAYPIAMGVGLDQVEDARSSVAKSLQVCAPDDDEAILRAGGFSDVTLFYAAFAWRGWVGYA